MTRRVFGLHPTILLLAGTHFVVDGFSNILAPLLPVIIANLHLSLAAAGTLQMCLLLSNSVAQLGFGHLADRWRPRLLLLAGPVLSICVMPLVGIATTWWTLAACLLVGGLGAAAFHPPAAAVVHREGTNRAGLAMAVHISSGSLGFALGPVLFAPFVQRFGLAWLPLMSLPALVLLAIFLRRIPAIDRLQEAHETQGFAGLRPHAKPLTLLYLIVVLRTLTAQAFSTFVAVLLVQRGQSIAAAGTAVAIYLFAASVGGFTGGPLADRFGPRRVIVLSLVSAVPFLAVAPSLSGWAFVAVLATGGFLLQSTLPVNVTFGQRLAPFSGATVSSLMMGFAWGTGGVCVPLVGMLADRVGIDQALTMMAAVPLVAAALALPLPAAPPTKSSPRPPATPVDPVAGHAPLGAD